MYHSFKKSAQVTTLTVSAIALAACGGGGGSSGGGSTGDTSADISGSGFVAGPVDGFGSIITNGVEMETGSATITDDGVPITEGDIDVGDNVIMRGTLNGDGTGTATTVVTDEFLKGPVDSVNTAENSFVAMGQTVVTNLDTVFDGVTLETLTPGQLVEVHGSLNGDDNILATRAELKGTLTEYEITGFIDTVDLAGSTFTINGLTVNFATAAVETEGGGPLAVGMFVDVESNAAPSGGTLTATEVEEEDSIPGVQPNDAAEIEGIITQVLSATRFVMNGITVDHDDSTRFEGGSSANLIVNQKIEVEGFFDDAGVLQAEEIEIETESNIEISSTVDNVNAGAGTFTILGMTVNTDIDTQFEDESALEMEPFTLDDMSNGDYVEMSGFQDGGDLMAQQVTRHDPNTSVELRGPLDSDNGVDTMVILGITVMTDGSTTYEDENENPISADNFYTTVDTGDVVEVEQDPAGDPIVADEVEIEELVP